MFSRYNTVSYLRASNEGVLDRTAFLQAGSAACEMTRMVS